MFVVKFRPQPVLAVKWKGDKFEEICQLFSDSSVQQLGTDIIITDNICDDIKLPLYWFVVKYGSKAITFSPEDFIDIFEDYFNPHEHYNVSPDSDVVKEVESSNPDPEFIDFL